MVPCCFCSVAVADPFLIVFFLLGNFVLCKDIRISRLVRRNVHLSLPRSIWTRLASFLLRLLQLPYPDFLAFRFQIFFFQIISNFILFKLLNTVVSKNNLFELLLLISSAICKASSVRPKLASVNIFSKKLHLKILIYEIR